MSNFPMPIRKPSSNLEKNQPAAHDASRTLKARRQKVKSIASSELDPHISDNLVNNQAQAEEKLKVSTLKVESDALGAATATLSEFHLQPLTFQPSTQTELQPSNLQPSTVQPSTQPLEWLIHFQRHSQLLMAVVEPGTFTLRYANDYFCSMMGIACDLLRVRDS
jgi:hypothetical protein